MYFDDEAATWLLIEPFGIETESTSHNRYEHKQLLIEPFGIETVMVSEGSDVPTTF